MTNLFGKHTILDGQAGFFRMGPLSLEIQRKVCEWRVLAARGRDALDATVEVVVPCAPTQGARRDVDVVRFGVDGPVEELELSPVLPDRAIVCATDPPLFVPPDEAVTLHVGTPIWLRVDLLEPRRKLYEVATVVLSDTWFGPPTATEGEVCYAIRTAGRLHKENLPRRPHIARTEVSIVNRSKEALSVAKLRIPIPLLGLYLSSEGLLWTDRLSLVRRDERDMAELRLDKEGAKQLGQLVAPPRSTESSSFVRTFASVFNFAGASFGN